MLPNVRFIIIALCIACAPSIASASYEDFRLLYDWGGLGPYTSGPRVLGESDTPIPAGSKVEGYIVQLGGETFLAKPGEDLHRITLPADVDISLIKGKYIAGEVSSSDGGVATLAVAVPAPAPTGESTTSDKTSTESQDPSTIDLGDPGVTPENRFLSFFDHAGERIQRAFIFNGVKLAQYEVSIARERLAETKQLLAQNKTEAAARAADGYQASVEQLSGEVAKLDPKKQQEIEGLNKEIASHAALLNGDFVTGTPQEFRDHLAPVAQATGQALAVLADKKGAPALTPEMVDRIQAAASLGTLPKGVAVALFASKNRAEALQGVETQVHNGFLAAPDADYLRFDAVRSNYKDSFEKAHEVSKLEYIKKADTERKQLEQDPALKKQMEDFGKNFKEGQEPPENLRRLWATSVNGEAAQMTFRPDKLSSDQLKNPELKILYDNVRQHLSPTQSEIEGVAKQQSNSPRFLPQFEHVFRLAGSGTREDASQDQKGSFGGCTSAEECVNKAKEFQQKYATPEERRAAFGQEFQQLDRPRPPQGDQTPSAGSNTDPSGERREFPQGDQNRARESQPRPQGSQNQQQQQNQQHPANQPGFWNGSYPNPKDMTPRSNDQQRLNDQHNMTSQENHSSEGGNYSGSYQPNNSPSEENHPPEGGSSGGDSGGGGSGEQAPPSQ